MTQESFWEQQKNNQWKILTNPLKNDPRILSQFNNLITNFYWKFREKKGIKKGNYNPEINFQGFAGFQDFPDRAGHCESDIEVNKEWKTVNGEKVEGSKVKTYFVKLKIELHQHFLLDRLGMDKFFHNERTYTSVGFNDLIATIAHEIAHAFQTTINLKKKGVKSQCESTGDRDVQGNLLYPGLAIEHTKFTAEIKSMIESSAEHQRFKRWWEEGKNNDNQKEKCEECGTELYTRNTSHGSAANKVSHKGKEICVDCHHKLVREENQKQCLYCQKYFSELIENKACESCAKKNTSYSCKTCGEKFSLDANLNFQEAKQKAYQTLKNHENQVHKQGSKCSKCGKVQGREDFYLTTDSETKQQLGYYCETCKNKLEQERKEKQWEHTNVRGPGNQEQNKPQQSHPDNAKKWGQDFGQLKPLQREGRIKTQNSWSNKKNISFICIHCQKLFPYDKTIENYLEARQKAQTELNNHKKTCSLKGNESAKTGLQKFWDEARKSKRRIIKTCEKCWGKVLWDKSIENAETARQQALSDLKYHQEKECGMEGKKKIAIYHSPNSGGNEHAPMDNSLTDDGIYLFDNEGEIHQTQESKKNYWPWIVGGLVGVGIIGVLVWIWRNRGEDK